MLSWFVSLLRQRDKTPRCALCGSMFYKFTGDAVDGYGKACMKCGAPWAPVIMSAPNGLFPNGKINDPKLKRIMRGK